MIKYTLISLILIAFTLGSNAQLETKLFSVEELKEDFTYWRDKLETKSPLLYYYNSKEESDRYLDSIYALIDHPMTETEFYKIVSPTTFFLKDVHSGIQVSPTIYQSIINHPSIIPIDIVWLEDAAYVAVSDSLGQIKRGTQVLTINDVDVAEIIQAGMHRISNDGYSTASSKFSINSNFWLFYHRLFGHSDTYTIEYLDDSSEKQSVVLKGADWHSLWKSREGMNRPMFRDDLPLITLDFIDTLSTAILRVRSFDNNFFKEVNKGKFDPQIKAAIKQIEAVQPSNLILDIRANSGGDPINGKLILKYLLNEKFRISGELRTVKREEAEDFYVRTKKVYVPFYGLGKFKPGNKYFSGDVYVLINGGTSSAAGEFSGALRKSRNVTFIGSEAGGNSTILSGTYLKKKHFLPNTKLQVFVGTMCTINDDLDKDQGYGLIPDYTIPWKPKDLLTINDPVRSFTYNLIQKSNRQKEILGQLKDSINSQYGLYEGAPSVNSGPCGNFANLFYENWNKRFDEKVSISFIMSADSSECYHVLTKLPNGDYYDGGNGILTKQQLIDGYEKGMYIIDMLEYDFDILDEMAYGLDREYPRCQKYSVEKTSQIIDFHLNMLRSSLD